MPSANPVTAMVVLLLAVFVADFAVPPDTNASKDAMCVTVALELTKYTFPASVL